MQRTLTDLTFAPSDLNHFVECEHLTSLDLLAADGLGVEKEKDPQAEIIRAKGLEHERAWLERQRAAGRHIVAIAGDGRIDWVSDAARTIQAMREGVEIIYQGVFVDAPWRGIADFLVRVDRPSSLGRWSYEAWDTKLARHPKPYFILQLCWYTEQLTRLQGHEPRRMHVVLASGEPTAFEPRDFLAYYGAVRQRFLRAVGRRAATYPLPVGHCHVCGYTSHCAGRREADDHLSLVAGMRRDQIERLGGVGVVTLAELSVSGSDKRAGINPQTFERLTRQASLQFRARVEHRHRWELLAPEPRRGFGLLPAPSAGDLFFDIEGYPYFEPTHGLEYLWGVSVHDGQRWVFQSFECVDRAGEKAAFERFIDFVRARLERHPDLHVYHYAAYETAVIKRLMGGHGTREAEVDDLLRREVFVDLYQVVRQSMQASYDGYSLKKIRQFFMRGAGHGAVSDGGASILEFQKFLESGDPAILASIRDYNAEDCESTRQLRDWLIDRKGDAQRQFGVEIPWATSSEAVTESPVDRDNNAEVRESLTALADAAPTDDRAELARLLANLLNYHRREEKPGWWAYFERLRKSLDELRDDTESIAYLSPVEDVQPFADKKSLVHTLAFPDQEFKTRAGTRVREAVEGKPAGDIVAIDLSGRLQLRRGPTLADVPLPRALIADGPPQAVAQRESLARIGRRLIAGEIADRVGRDILARGMPRLAGRLPGMPVQTMDLRGQQELVAALDDSYLFVQGPPGSGKTYAGARMIVKLLAAGQRVAVTATSHKAIHNLLDEVVQAGREMRVPIRGLKKSSSGTRDSEYDGEGFTNTTSPQACEDSDAPLVAATSWQFAREAMTGQFDYLFIDEAGQVSLADAVAMSPCARNLVLLGDPQQLPHVTQGVHPGGVGVSVLEHLLGEESTVSPDHGVFLEQTWRMHPDVCAFISDLSYDGRLHAHPSCARQRVDTPGLGGTGLRYLPVEHAGNSQQSVEEAATVAAEVRAMLDGGTFTDRHGITRPLTPVDILVVAPYNMQVHALMDALPVGVEVGTVDKFQGREAPVVFFSLATSSGDEIPRGLEFLFSRNRLNVAISRAKALAVLVCSPRLLETRCRTVDQMRLVNALCEFVEHRGTTSCDTSNITAPTGLDGCAPPCSGPTTASSRQQV